MRISVIVAVYNIEKYIAKCIESIMNQSYQELEIILVDDGSTDESGRICDAYARKDDRIKVIHRENGGLSAARNTGIENATGSYIGFVDGDDWIDEPMYEKMADMVKQYAADLVVCRYRCIYNKYQKDGSTGKITVFEKPLEMLTQCLREEEEFQIQHAAWNKIYKRELLGTKRFPEGKWYEDVVFSAQILSETKVGVYIDSAFYNYVCEREGSIMNAGMTEKFFTDWIPAYIEKENYLESLDNREPLCTHRYFFYKRLLSIYRDLFKKENKRVRKYKKQIESILRDRKNTFEEVYKLEIAAKTEKVKMQIFMIAPLLFRMFMAVNDAVILPLKLKRMEKRC